MTSIRVVSPGMFTTVQDLGRPGYGAAGVSVSGAADPIALRLGNRLVGNAHNAAALEMTLLGGTFDFPEGALVAFSGAQCSVHGWEPIELNAGETLRAGPIVEGARSYLCVRGGIDVPLFLGSASTHVLTGLGGFEGRALRKGDVLRIGREARPLRRVSPEQTRLSFRHTFRVTAGPQHFSSLDTLLSSAYRVADDSNRMGLRLQGPSIEAPGGGQMITEGVSLGALQVPASGQPIIIFVEQQTTGGYPKIANIITADLPAIGQLRPRDEIRFELVDDATALQLLREQESLLEAR